MKLSLTTKLSKTDLLVLPLFEDEKLSTDIKKSLGSSLVKSIESHFKAKNFEGKSGQSLAFYPENSDAKKVLLLGRGDKKKSPIKEAELLGGKMAGLCKGHKKVTLHLPEKEFLNIGRGFALGSYSFDTYKKKDKDSPVLANVSFLTKAGKTELSEIQAFMEASSLTRDLVNTPAGDLNTKDLEAAAKKVAKEHKLKVTVLDEKKLKSLGCGSILGVGRGAEVPPRIVILEYKNKSKSKVPNLALLGKGIVFDTGGLNLKPTGYMETMKQDMAGAATVLGAMKAIAMKGLKGYFIAVLCCAENAISEKATRPGDVLKAYNGKTIEVTNTDAEGRLALADGLAYVEKNYKPKNMLTIATLTGAVSVALGYHITGAMGTNPSLTKDLLSAAKEQDERAWELPLHEDFVKATKGEFTDLKNSTNGVRAGASMGGAFLRNFVEDTPWVHLDIGGTAWAEKPSSTTKYGSTGAMVRTLTALAAKHQD